MAREAKAKWEPWQWLWGKAQPGVIFLEPRWLWPWGHEYSPGSGKASMRPCKEWAEMVLWLHKTHSTRKQQPVSVKKGWWKPKTCEWARRGRVWGEPLNVCCQYLGPCRCLGVRRNPDKVSTHLWAPHASQLARWVSGKACHFILTCWR